MTSYQWDAEDYEKHSHGQKSWGRELIGKLSLQGTEKILDIGCGDGRLTAELAIKVRNGVVIGIDSSAEMVRRALENHPPSRFPNLRFLVMDARSISFREEFDVVFSNAALHWVKDHRPVLEGVSRCLKPGGRFLFQMGGKGNAEDVVRIFQKVISSDRWTDYFEDFEFPYGFYGVEEYEVLTKDTGLEIDRIELIEKVMILDDMEGFRGWIRTTWLPYTQRVPENLRSRFIDEVVRSYVGEIPPDMNGKIRVVMKRLEVEGRKGW